MEASASPNKAIEPSALGKAHKSSYGQILKSSAIVGGSSVVTIALGVVRTKVLALLLGPSGVGLVGLFTSILELARNVAGMGVSSSAVRQIAESIGYGSEPQIARTVLALRRVALVLGIAGALTLLALCRPVAQLTFGNDRQTGSVALLSMAVLFGVVSAGQMALVQGMRRITDLARLSMLGAVCGTVFSIPILYFLRERGIALFLVVVAGMGLLSSWWYARKIVLVRLDLRWSAVWAEASALLKPGFAFMVSSLMSIGTAYVVRVLVLRKLGVDAAGFYQAAWVLAGLYVGFILQAMGTDFFPRLTAVAKDNVASNRMVNEQTEVGLLIAVPGILATLACAPLVIHAFYSAEFEPAVKLLQWSCLGMLLRVASWPMGFIILAKARMGLFMLTESLSNLTYIVLVWLGMSLFGLVGTGMAFLGMYLFCWLLVFLVTRKLSGFRWSNEILRLSAYFVPVVVAVFLVVCLLPMPWGMPLGLLATMWAGYYSLAAISRLVPAERLPGVVLQLLALLRIAPTSDQT